MVCHLLPFAKVGQYIVLEGTGMMTSHRKYWRAVQASWDKRHLSLTSGIPRFKIRQLLVSTKMY